MVGAPAAGKEGFDGIALLPFLSGEEGGAPHEAFYWRFGAQMAMRKGGWKLLQTRGVRIELYHLSEDIGEERDLTAEQVENGEAQELLEAWEAWDDQFGPPRWRKN